MRGGKSRFVQKEQKMKKPKKIKTSKRLPWDEYFMEITNVIAKRSTCMKRKVGAVIVKERRVLSTGYNGAPKGLAHCEAVGCIRMEMKIPSGQRHELCRGLHAEQNAIIQAAWDGVKIQGSTLYCTCQPCVICVKMMINAGILRVVFEGDYPDDLAANMLIESGLEICKMEEIKSGKAKK
jgi:dCMP deaminase